MLTYYSALSKELGDAFYEVVAGLLADIEVAPRMYRSWQHGPRRHFSPRFPYALIHAEPSDPLVVLAVAHFKRGPS